MHDVLWTKGIADQFRQINIKISTNSPSHRSGIMLGIVSYDISEAWRTLWNPVAYWLRNSLKNWSVQPIGYWIPHQSSSCFRNVIRFSHGPSIWNWIPPHIRNLHSAPNSFLQRSQDSSAFAAPVFVSLYWCRQGTIMSMTITTGSVPLRYVQTTASTRWRHTDSSLQ